MKWKIDMIALSILIATAVNCGLIAIFSFNVMTWLFDGQNVAASRMVYALVAVAGLWCLNLMVVQGRKNRTVRNVAPNPMPYPASNSMPKLAPMIEPDPNPAPNPTPNPAPNPAPKPDPRSLKDNPPDETVCSPHFSQGCVNEDTNPPVVREGKDEDEKQ